MLEVCMLTSHCDLTRLCDPPGQHLCMPEHPQSRCSDSQESPSLWGQCSRKIDLLDALLDRLLALGPAHDAHGVLDVGHDHVDVRPGVRVQLGFRRQGLKQLQALLVTPVMEDRGIGVCLADAGDAVSVGVASPWPALEWKC